MSSCHLDDAARMFSYCDAAGGLRESFLGFSSTGLTGWWNHVTRWAALSAVATGQRGHGNLPNSSGHGRGPFRQPQGFAAWKFRLEMRTVSAAHLSLSFFLKTFSLTSAAWNICWLKRSASWEWRLRICKNNFTSRGLQISQELKATRRSEDFLTCYEESDLSATTWLTCCRTMLPWLTRQLLLQRLHVSFLNTNRRCSEMKIKTLHFTIQRLFCYSD